MQGHERRAIAQPHHVQLPDDHEQHGQLSAQNHGQSQLPQLRRALGQRQTHQRRATGKYAQPKGQHHPRPRATGPGLLSTGWIGSLGFSLDAPIDRRLANGVRAFGGAMPHPGEGSSVTLRSNCWACRIVSSNSQSSSSTNSGKFSPFDGCPNAGSNARFVSLHSVLRSGMCGAINRLRSVPAPARGLPQRAQHTVGFWDDETTPGTSCWQARHHMSKPPLIVHSPHGQSDDRPSSISSGYPPLPLHGFSQTRSKR